MKSCFVSVLLLGVLVLTAVAADAPATTLTEQDRQLAVNYLKETRDAFLKSVNGLSEAQAKYKPAPERWSVAEVSEHIAVSEDFIFGRVQQMLKMPPATDEKRAATRGMEQKIMQAIPDRTNRVQAPETLRPTGKFATLDDAVKGFKEKRNTGIAYVEKTQDPLRAHTMPSPLGEIDAYQFLLFMAAHSKRHTAQIEELKADPNFPKK